MRFLSLLALTLSACLPGASSAPAPPAAPRSEVPAWVLHRDATAAYLFRWVGSFHGPVTARAELVGPDVYFFTDIASHPPNLPPLAAELSLVRRGTLADWDRLTRAVEAAGFWQASGNPIGGLDGAVWTVYGYEQGRGQHTTAHWSPDPGPFRDLCLTLTRLGPGVVPVDSLY